MAKCGFFYLIKFILLLNTCLISFFKILCYNIVMKDLHIHTCYSDGQYNEYEILDKICGAGITEFAICDHDNIEGSKRVFNALQQTGHNLKFHSGVELSCAIPFNNDIVNIHMLAHNFGFDEQNIKSLTDQMAKNRIIKAQRTIKLVEKIYNVTLPPDKIQQAMASTKSFGKPHVYAILCTLGSYDRKQFYDNLDAEKNIDLKLNAIDVINAVHKGTGTITLAHPKEIMEEYNLSYKHIDQLVGMLAQHGLDGLETKHSKHTAQDTQQFAKIAEKYGLMQTQGSDFHGEKIKPDVKLGVCQKQQ